MFHVAPTRQACPQLRKAGGDIACAQLGGVRRIDLRQGPGLGDCHHVIPSVTALAGSTPARFRYRMALQPTKTKPRVLCAPS